MAMASQMPAASGEATCSLCGLPLGRSGVVQRINGKDMGFCCPGCRAVYQILLARYGEIPEDPTQTDLYKACLRAGLVIPREEELSTQTPLSPPSSDQEVLGLSLEISGMGCPTCAWLLEQVLTKIEGVSEVRVSFASDLTRVKYRPSELAPKEIMARIRSLGYEASLVTEKKKEGSSRSSWIRLGVSAVLTVHVMMISWALYAGFVQELSPESVTYLSIPLLALSTPVLFWCGLPLLRRGLSGMRHLSPNLESLVGLGALSAYTFSLFQLLAGGLHLYFDTASMLVTLVLLGRALEDGARASVREGCAQPRELAAQKARLIRKGVENWVPAREVTRGDFVKVEHGETVPVDGVVSEGRGTLDLSALTGESRPLTVREGGLVLAGSVLLEGEVSVRAKDDGAKSLLASMASMVEEGLSLPSALERLADRLSRWFVPGVVGLALATAICMWMRGAGLDIALLRGLTVLVIACPCALGVATPLARVAAVRLGQRFGIWVRDSGVLEGGDRIQAMVMDKTGTLTAGCFTLREILTFQEDPELLLYRAASVELSSVHFLAQQVVAHARSLGVRPVEADGFEEVPGQGVCGVLDGVRVCVGNRAWMARWGLGIPEDGGQEAVDLESQGFTVVFVGWDGRARGALIFGDAVKPGASETVSALKDRGVEVWLVSGDSVRTTSAVARHLGVEKFLGESLPQDKASLVERLSFGGRRVGVVGDGLNDAPALSKAHIGIALGSTLAVPGAAASIHASRTDPAAVLDVLELCRRTRRTVVQNLLFSLCYNLAAIPVAMTGLLSPPLAVLAMFASSLTVIGNSRRLARGTLSQPVG